MIKRRIDREEGTKNNNENNTGAPSVLFGALSPISATEPPAFRDCLEVDEIVKLLSDQEVLENPSSEFNLKTFSELFALDCGETNLLENAENNERHIRDIENTIFEFTQVESEDEISSDDDDEEVEEEVEEQEEEDEEQEDERSATYNDSENDEESNTSSSTTEKVECLMKEIEKEIREEKGAYELNLKSKQNDHPYNNQNIHNSDDCNEVCIEEEDEEECLTAEAFIRKEPTSSKLNILTLSTLNYSIYEHPDRFEVRNIMYFSNVTKCKLFRERQFIGVSEIIDTFYGGREKKIQLPNFVMFQILFSIIEKLYEMNEDGLIKKIPNIEQDEHLFRLYRNRHVEKYHVIEKLFLDNVEISPKFKSVDYFQDQVGLSQFIDVNILDKFEKTIQDLDLCESDIIFCLGIFILEIVFSTTNASRMIFKILSQPYNEPLICEMILQDNRSNWCLIRIILSMLRINEPYRLVPKPFYEMETVEDAQFVPRITLENLIGIEMAHVCTILCEDRKVFEYFTVPFLAKLTGLPHPDLLNNPFHPSSYKYVATTEGGKKIDLLYSFFAGIVLYGSKNMKEADKYLRQSVLHPNLENDNYAQSITKGLDSLDYKENAATIVDDIAKACTNDLLLLQKEITDRFEKAQTKLPFFAYVSYSFLGKALAEMKQYPLSLFYTEYSFVCSKLQQTPNFPIFNSSAIFTKAYIVHKYDIFDISSNLYEQVISNFKGHSMAHNNRGICLKRLKASKQAIDEYELSLRIDPSNHLGYNNRAMYFYADDEYENSILYYKMAIRLKPTYQLPITNLGLTYTQLNKFNEAIELLSKVLVWAPNNVNALVTRGFCHMRKSNYTTALADYSKLVHDLELEERSTLFNMSLCYYQTQRYREAIYYSSKIIKKNPRDDRAHYYRALFYEKYNKFEEAFDDVNVFLDLSPANAAGTILRSRLLNTVKKITRIS